MSKAKRIAFSVLVVIAGITAISIADPSSRQTVLPGSGLHAAYERGETVPTWLGFHVRKGGGWDRNL